MIKYLLAANLGLILALNANVARAQAPEASDALVDSQDSDSEESSFQTAANGRYQNVADIIVIGGGTSGSILMSELSGNGFSVMGLEAGQNLSADPAIQAVGLPALQLAQTGRAQYFWPGWSQTLPMAGLNGRTGDWTTGMLLGGGSAVNGLYYGRGSSAAYATWEQISGSTNWNSNSIAATFTALENYEGLTITPGARGTSGAVNTLQTPTASALTLDVLLPATLSAFPGIPTVLDYNDPNEANCIDLRAQWLIDSTGSQRVSSANAFLNESVMTPAGQGVNGHKLFVHFGAVPVQIVIDKSGTARRVKYMQGGKLHTAIARKAVVLAADINSSKLLQLSGIGPAQALANAGIKPVFINENVGKNLQNHPLLSINMLADPAENGIPSGAPYAYTIQNVYLPAVGGAASDPRSVQILFNYIPATNSSPALLNLSLELLNPQSTGSVTIQSGNVFQIAAVDDGFYQNPADLTNMKNAVETYLRAMLEQLSLLYPFPSPYFRPMVSDPINTVIFSGYDDTVVDAYVKNNSNLSLDPHDFTSDCKMAPLNAGGVVDGNTLVYGTKNLFVADNSICPAIPDNETTATAMMIGLRTSEILKQVLQKNNHHP